MAKNGSSAPYQPVTTGGAFGFLQRLFVSTPTYAGVGQPPPTAGGVFGGFFGGTPAYRTTSTKPPTPSECDPASCDQLPPNGQYQSSTESTFGTAPDSQSQPLTIVITRD